MVSTLRAAMLFVATAALTGPAFALSGESVIRTGPAVLTVSWSAVKPVDVFVSDRPDATEKTATLVSRADTDGRYETPADTTRRYFLLREARSKTAVRVAERELPLTGGTNFRDLGGYPAAGGKHVRWGLIYRSAATPMLTAEDIARVKALGLTRMIDLRSSEERQLAPTNLTGIRYEAIDYAMASMTPRDASGNPGAMRNSGQLYRNMAIFLAPQIRMVFDDLLGRKGPVMYHCTAGQDRTGVVTAMILTALGTPRATILQDYHLTTQLLKPERTMPKITPAMAEINPVAKMFAAYQHDGAMTKAQPLRDPDGRAFLESAFDEIERRYGSVEAFLAKEAGVGSAEIAQLRAAYTE